jgi:DNA-binding protein HU-beta
MEKDDGQLYGYVDSWKGRPVRKFRLHAWLDIEKRKALYGVQVLEVGTNGYAHVITENGQPVLFEKEADALEYGMNFLANHAATSVAAPAHKTTEGNMTQQDLINRVNQRISPIYGSNAARVSATMAALGEVAAETLKDGGEVTFPGGLLGKLVVVATAARTRRNPRTGAPVQVPAGRAARFKAAAKLKAALKD